MTVKNQSGSQQLESVSPETFADFITSFRSALEDTAARQIFIALFGGEKTLEAFRDSRGVGIGVFSKLVDLPVSTVRHYIEVGLVKPYLVNGKFRFVAPNIAEVHHVRQWADLGLTLEEIAQRLEERQGMHGVLPDFELNGETISSASVFMARDMNASRAFVRITGQADAMQFDFVPRANSRVLLADLESQIEMLEGKRRLLNAKLERAHSLKSQLEPFYERP
jgi:DNA-binding transcriptional MerR regulator